jgi:hypothetical protein
MGRAYSISGYLNAALRRTGKTILVEGPSDKHALHRIALERFPASTGNLAIDHAAMIDDPQLAGMGNKARVLYLHTCVDALKAIVPKIETVLATLTDREWDGVVTEQYVPDPAWTPPTQLPNRFVTLGHSIENYHFDFDCAKEYLKFAFAEHVGAQLFAVLESRFTALLVLAAILTLKLRDDQNISRSASLIDVPHLAYRNDRYYLEPSFGIACGGRAIATSATIVADVNAAIDAAWDKLRLDATIKWLPHGHIGDDILWTGVAHSAQACGIPAEITAGIAHGHKKDRERFKSQWLSKVHPDKRVPLDQSVDWLHT